MDDVERFIVRIIVLKCTATVRRLLIVRQFASVGGRCRSSSLVASPTIVSRVASGVSGVDSSVSVGRVGSISWSITGDVGRSQVLGIRGSSEEASNGAEESTRRTLSIFFKLREKVQAKVSTDFVLSYCRRKTHILANMILCRGLSQLCCLLLRLSYYTVPIYSENRVTAHTKFFS